MKKIFILLCLSAIFVSAAWGLEDEEVHGYGGYYYFNAKRLQAEENATPQLFRVDDKVGFNIKGSHRYEDNMLRVNIGQQTERTDATIYFGGYAFLRESTWGYQNPLNLTADYPIVAFKLNVDSAMTVDNKIWVHIKIEAYKSGLSGSADNRLMSQAADINKWGEWKNAVTTASEGKKVECIQLSASEDDACDRIFYFNLKEYGVFKDVSTADLGRFRMDIGSYLDTTGVAVENYPKFDLKWVRTFKSIDELNNDILNYRGDGVPETRTDNQIDLYQALFAGNELLKEYENSKEEVIDAFRSQLEEYEAVYNEAVPSDPSSEEWAVWNAKIAAAVVAVKNLNDNLIASLAWVIDEDRFMIYITSIADGKQLSLGADETITVGNKTITGKKLVFGSKGLPFFAVSRGTINNIPSYSLIADGYYLAFHNGALFAVPGANRGDVITTLNFVNRDRENDFYSLAIGGSFGFNDGYELSLATDIPKDDSELGVFLFDLESYEYTWTDGDPTGKIEWEFNNSNDTEGWTRNNWRPFVSIKQSVVDNLGVLEQWATETYQENKEGRPIASTPFPTGTSLRREAGSFAGGQYPNEYELNPKSDSIQHRPLDYEVSVNSGKNRYFAVKIGTNDSGADMTLGNFTFYRAFGEGYLLEFSKPVAKKGDVYIFDLLSMGIPPGDVRFVNQYMGNFPLNSTTSRVYIDWMRTYETLGEIPEESFSFSGNSIDNPAIDNLGIYAYGALGALRVENTSGAVANISVYTSWGTLVYSGTINNMNTTIPATTGIYIVKASVNGASIVQKVIVK